MITLTRTSDDDATIRIPVDAALCGIDLRLVKFPATGVHSIQGIVARALVGPPRDLAIMPAVVSVMEYVAYVGEAGAAVIGFDAFGCQHGKESVRAPLTMTLDGIDVLNWIDGRVEEGRTCVVHQQTTAHLPKHANGDVDGVTPIGIGTLTHTFSDAGLTIAHTHAIDPGIVCKTLYAAMLPTHSDTFLWGAVNGGVPIRFLRDGTTVSQVGRVRTYAAWSPAHRIHCHLTLPTGPNLTNDWSRSGVSPTECPLLHNLDNAKLYVQAIAAATYAGATDFGTTAHEARYHWSAIRTYPAWRYHATQPPILVRDEADAVRVGVGWSDIPTH